jgi:NADPH-dependent 2,4-dienoyl-CoA reductase/sulfur reductase-like enzyme
MSEQTALAIVGAGPAGLEAAVAAAEAGTPVTLIDSHPQPGGQYFKQLPVNFRSGDRTPHHQAGQALLARLGQTETRLLNQTLVWGAFPNPDGPGWLLALHGPKAPTHLQAKALILAGGAYDRPIPFPGWTLPGVMTAGAAQTLLKSQRLLPGRRILLSGTGPLQLAVAAQLAQTGAEVVGVLEGASFRPGPLLVQLPALWGQGARLREGWTYGRALWRAGVPYHFGRVAVAALGEEEVEAVVTARLDDHWQPIPGTEERLAVDTLLIGYGFSPDTQLSRLLGCEHDFIPEWGGTLPRRDERMQTSLPGLYAAGDGAGIGGADLARLEGRIAGLAVAQDLGRLSETAARTAIARLQPALARERRFARMLGALFSPGPGLYSLAADQTIICRCEAVRLGVIRAAVADGARSATEVKGLTRCGMGNCQGRICGQLVARAIAAELTGGPPKAAQIEAAGSFTARPPIHPLPLSVLAEAESSLPPQQQNRSPMSFT